MLSCFHYKIYLPLTIKKKKYKKSIQPLLIFLKQCYIITMKQKNRKPFLKFTDKQLNDIYDSGRETTVNFMKMLIDKINQLEERVKELEDQISKDSHNSNKPPSSDAPFRKPKSLRQKSGKKQGGQKNHKGSTLKQVQDPKQIKKISPTGKCDCGKNLRNAEILSIIKRQLFDIIVTPIFVTEYQGEVKKCSCGQLHYPLFPEIVKKEAQYGPNIKSLAVYLKHYGFISYDRIAELFKDVFKAKISQGTLVNIINECSNRVLPIVEYIKKGLIDSEVCHFDETGIQIEGSLHWLHSAGTDRLTCYAPHKNRGQDAMQEIGILPYFNGIAIHDYWKSYYKFTECKHGLCNYHHLRELIFFEEKGEKWALKIKSFLLDIKKEKDENGYLSTCKIKRYKKRLRRLINEGIKIYPEKIKKNKCRGRPGQSKEYNLLKRFRDRLDEVLRFIINPSVPFGNNLAEQDVRMTKIQQKVSGSFRSMKGAVSFCMIRSYISSIRKCGLSVFVALKSLWSSSVLYPNT